MYLTYNNKQTAEEFFYDPTTSSINFFTFQLIINSIPTTCNSIIFKLGNKIYYLYFLIKMHFLLYYTFLPNMMYTCFSGTNEN